jgi:protein phosphatase-4 regulatory subunit 3
MADSHHQDNAILTTSPVTDEEGTEAVAVAATSQEASEQNSDASRVKLYKLNEQGQWDDLGTGHAECLMHNDGNCYLHVTQEEEPQLLLLECKIIMEDAYARQGDTIITWNEPSRGCDLALSFANADRCQGVWAKICHVQGRYISYYKPDDHASLGSHDGYGMTHDRDDQHQYINNPHDGVGGGGQSMPPVVELPAVEVENLAIIGELFGNASHMVKTQYSNSVAENDGSYLKSLFALLEYVDDLDDTSSLTQFFCIFKNIILLNCAELFELLLSETYWIPLMLALESDPELPARAHHRKYLEEEVVFNQVVPITDSKILAKVHQNFRIQYLKDVVLPRTLDDASIATFNSILYFNNVEIVKGLYEDDAFMTSMFQILEASFKNPQALCDVLSFIQEMCHLAKNLQPQSRSHFYGTLKLEKFRLLPFLESVISSNDYNALTHTRAIEILINIVLQDAKYTRRYISKILEREKEISGNDLYRTTFSCTGLVGVAHGSSSSTNAAAATAAALEAPRGTLLFQIIRRMIVGVDPGVQAQAAELLKLILDPEGMDATEKDTFLENFYSVYIRWLVHPFVRGQLPEEKTQPSGDGNSDDVAKLHICELLTFCITQHGYRAKFYILRGNICYRVLVKLAYHKEKYLMLAGIRFIKHCVQLKDDIYNRFLIKNDMFRPVFDVFEKHINRNNMINSAVIDLVEYICAEDIKVLAVYIIDNFRDLIKRVTYVPTFTKLISKYEVSQHAPGSSLSHLIGTYSIEEELKMDLAKSASATAGGSGNGGDGIFGSSMYSALGLGGSDGSISGSKEGLAWHEQDSLRRLGPGLNAESEQRRRAYDEEEAYFDESDEEYDYNLAQQQHIVAKEGGGGGGGSTTTATATSSAGATKLVDYSDEEEEANGVAGGSNSDAGRDNSNDSNLGKRPAAEIIDDTNTSVQDTKRMKLL